MVPDRDHREELRGGRSPFHKGSGNLLHHMGRAMDAQDFKARRTELGLTQAALAAELGVTEATIANYESGRSDVPRTVELAVQMLSQLRIEDTKNVRARLIELAKKYATAFESLQHDNMAHFWTNEISPIIQSADSDEHTKLRAIVHEAVYAKSRPLRVYDAALKHRGVLSNLHAATNNLNEKRALAEILKILN